jgi:hypothetical protein
MAIFTIVKYMHTSKYLLMVSILKTDVVMDIGIIILCLDVVVALLYVDDWLLPLIPSRWLCFSFYTLSIRDDVQF